MIKKILLAVMAMVMMTLSACQTQTNEVKRIEKEKPNSVESNETGSSDVEEKEPNDTSQVSQIHDKNGLFYRAETDAGSIDVYMDMPMAEVLEKIGEAPDYYEARSCAFDGLDKMYTYQHFEIDTYPAEDGDHVSAVFLLDDLTGTPEGIFVGSAIEEAEEKYGKDYEDNGTEIIYTIDNMKLKLQITDGKVSYITYESMTFGLVAGASERN